MLLLIEGLDYSCSIRNLLVLNGVMLIDLSITQSPFEIVFEYSFFLCLEWDFDLIKSFTIIIRYSTI